VITNSSLNLSNITKRMTAWERGGKKRSQNLIAGKCYFARKYV
jgi:hypothetical protein